MGKPYPLRVPENLMSLAKLRAKEEHINQSTALKQLLYAGAEDYTLDLLKKERITVGMAAELLERSIYDIYRLAKEKRIQLGAKKDQYKKGKKVAEKLIK